MVLAIVGLCQAARWGVAETAALANIAAGLEVERLGVAPVSWDEIRAELQRGPTYFPSPRTLSVDTTVVRGEGQAEGRLLGPYGPLTLTLSPHDRRNGSMTCGARGHERWDDRGERESCSLETPVVQNNEMPRRKPGGPLWENNSVSRGGSHREFGELFQRESFSPLIERPCQP
jgi:hypothetical protein